MASHPKLWSKPVKKTSVHTLHTRESDNSDHPCMCEECQNRRYLKHTFTPDTDLVAEKIARGSFGSIYVHRQDARKVIKYIIHEMHHETYLLECAILMCIRHPGIMYAHEIINRDGVGLYIVMPRAFADLGRYVHYRRDAGLSLTEADLLRWTVQILDALAFLHTYGIIHCDIKPNNIVLIPRDLVNLKEQYEPHELDAKLIDFGKSRYIRSRYYTKAVTYCVAPPEYVADNVSWSYSDHAANLDTWSLGCSLYDIFNGQRLYRDKKMQVPEDFSQVIDAIPDDCTLHMLIKKMLIYNPAKRPDAQEIFDDPLLDDYRQHINSNIEIKILSSDIIPITSAQKEEIFKMHNTAGFDIPPHEWVYTVVQRLQWALEQSQIKWDWRRLLKMAEMLTYEMHYDVPYVKDNFRKLSLQERNQLFMLLDKINYSLLKA